VVGSGRSRCWWANLIADSRRLIVPTFAPARASSVRYPLIVAAPAGSGACEKQHRGSSTRRFGTTDLKVDPTRIQAKSRHLNAHVVLIGYLFCGEP
jgi:hypothetical protein